MAVWHVFVVVVALVPGLPTEKPPRGDTTGWKWTKEKPDHDGCLGGTRKHAYIERRFHEVFAVHQMHASTLCAGGVVYNKDTERSPCVMEKVLCEISGCNISGMVPKKCAEVVSSKTYCRQVYDEFEIAWHDGTPDSVVLPVACVCTEFKK
ncbi:uncharacterized protein LOC128219050 [Mya arenaria]|uniref:uncharacterized protein LOC128219050 n=1 Tax=Mya arenaria TaxID=6604 RepID=UPI0022E54749|nr:uncharacterized protein LOC128219050 [Mya arenaria]